VPHGVGGGLEEQEDVFSVPAFFPAQRLAEHVVNHSVLRLSLTTSPAVAIMERFGELRSSTPALPSFRLK
jgi:hypothetical protein